MTPPATTAAPAPAIAAEEAGHGTCGNCGAALGGAYCAACGQHAHASARGLGAVVHDAWHDITHVDGRLWHTLALLLGRPGFLTLEYFRERRARYLPPVRLYLVLSVVFFTFTVTTSPIDERARPSAVKAALPTDRGPDATGADRNVDAQSALSSIGCGSVTVSGLPGVERALREGCERARVDGGKAFLGALKHNVPRMMFVFLPLVAVVMMLMYWRPRRYYVEHLVFLLHNHSALFLGFSIMSLATALAHLTGSGAIASAVDGVGTFVVVAFLAWYPYAAMRRYYGQGRTLSLAKYALLGLAYLVCLLLTLIGTAVFSAMEA